MSSATVRAAISTFLQPPAVPGLNVVYDAPPYWADGPKWQLATDLGSAAVGAVHLTSDEEGRITVPALTGQKAVEYEVALLVFYQWLIPSGTLSPVSADSWSGPLDSIIDGVKARIRSDPTLGCGGNGPVWQGGQAPAGIKATRDVPRRDAGKVYVFTAVEFHVTEIITA